MKNVFRLAAFALATVIFLTAVSIVFDGGYWFSKGYIMDRNARNAEITTETPGQIDVLNLGDSLSTSALTPLELYRDYGITSFNLGEDMQYTKEVYYALKLALRTQPIKVLLLEAGTLYHDHDSLEEAQIGLSEFWESKFPAFRYHNLWKMLFRKKGFRVYYKGFLVNEGLDPYVGERYYNTDNENRYPMDKDQKDDFDRIYRLCQENNIKLVLYSAASPVTYFYAMHNSIADLAEEYGIDYLDANLDIDLVGIDWETDTHDNGDHLNLFGTRKMTVYLGNYLRDNCDLPDHRSDPAYQEWTDLLVPYEQTIEEMRGTYYSELEDLLGY